MWIIVHSDQALEEWRPGVSTRMHVSALNGATHLCIFEQWIAPAAGVPTHEHPVEEVLAIVKDEAEIWIDEKRGVVIGGQSLIVPARRKHGFRNIGSETLHVHAVLASAIFEATFDGGTVQRWQS
jgi:mannose-6-phosphate isomerase-like protein (cupin superfamily)